MFNKQARVWCNENALTDAIVKDLQSTSAKKALKGLDSYHALREAPALDEIWRVRSSRIGKYCMCMRAIVEQHLIDNDGIFIGVNFVHEH